MNNLHFEEELFCVKYELDALSNYILNGRAERWVPFYTGDDKDRDHMNRYDLACEFVADQKVLDIACGVGKGSHHLKIKGNAREVIGADIDPSSIRYASHRYNISNVSFIEMDGLSLNKKEEFDVVTSFETIEHIKDYEIFIKNVWTSLKSNGLFIVSTPVSSKGFEPNPENPYHTQEWGFKEFQQVLLNEKFKIINTYIQLNLQLPPPSLYERIKKRLLYKKKDIFHFTGYAEKKIEEYNGQYPLDEFGVSRNGFQIVICAKI